MQSDRSNFFDTAFSALFRVDMGSDVVFVRVVPILHPGLPKDEEAYGGADDQGGGQQVDGAPAGEARHVLAVLRDDLTQCLVKLA